MPWIEAAMALPGKALLVGIAIWFHVGLKKSEQVAFSASSLTGKGVDRFAVGRGLAALEEAGLVAVVRAPGRKAIVTLLHPYRRTDQEVRP